MPSILQVVMLCAQAVADRDYGDSNILGQRNYSPTTIIHSSSLQTQSTNERPAGDSNQTDALS